jgi:hypothetical protein
VLITECEKVMLSSYPLEDSFTYSDQSEEADFLPSVIPAKDAGEDHV